MSNENNLNIVIFGANGNLARKKLYPALFEICDEYTQITGIGRKDLTDEDFRNNIKESNSKYDEDFLSRIRYFKGDIENIEDFKRLKEFLPTDNLLFYLAVEQSFFPKIVQSISEVGLNTSASRIVIEKPFGDDKDSAISLYNILNQHFERSQIYIIDHYLGKETVQNILAFRFGNLVFQQLWSKEFIDSIQITLAEDIGIEERGEYYDKAGAIKDMVQSHIVQILAAICMEAPRDFTADEIHNSKKALISSLKKLNVDEVGDSIVLGQYIGYLDEINVGRDSKTETFVSMRAYIDNMRWEGVPIYIRTGKRLETKVSEVCIKFKKSLEHLFPDTPNHSNILSFRLQPNEGISLKLSLKEPGREMELKDMNMDFCYKENFEISDNSYIRLMQDAIHNDESLFTTIDEITAAWEFVEPYIEYKKNYPEVLHQYEQHKWGPKESDELLNKDNREWISLYPYKCDINVNLQ